MNKLICREKGVQNHEKRSRIVIAHNFTRSFYSCIPNYGILSYSFTSGDNYADEVAKKVQELESRAQTAVVGSVDIEQLNQLKVAAADMKKEWKRRQNIAMDILHTVTGLF